MASKFDQVDYTKFIADYSIKNGELVDEFALNLSPQRLKKEINNVYNVINILNGNRIVNWNPVEDYIVGELVQNAASDDKYYRAKKVSNNKRPDLFVDDVWELATNADYTAIGDFNNFLAKDNETEYSPSAPYHPSTKQYVDYLNSLKLDLHATADNSLLLNGERVTATLSDSITKPAAVSLVKSVDDKADTKLDSSEFNATNIMAMVQNVDGLGSGLDADFLDGKSSEFFMKVDISNDFNTTITPGSYSLSPGLNGAPNAVETFSLVVYGQGNFVTQMAMSVTNGEFYYRNYVGSWSPWQTFVNPDGNVGSATKLANARLIGLSGGATGSVAFDGTNNVYINATITDDSHTHDGRYFTESESDLRFLNIGAKAVDSNLLDGLDNTKFLRTDIGGTVAGATSFGNNVTIDGNLTVKGTSSKINSVDLQVTDKNIEIGVAAIPTDDTADGGGITLLGSSNKTIKWLKSDNKWHFNVGIVANLTGTASDASKLNNKILDVNATPDTIVLRTPGGTINGKASDAELLDGYNSSVSAAANTVVVRDSSSLIKGSVENANTLDGFDSSQIAAANTVVVRDGSGIIDGTVKNADTLDGYDSSVIPSADTVAVRNYDGDLDGSISNAYRLNNINNDVAATANTIVQRDASADVNARLFRSNYQTQTSLSATADICFRNDTSDNYMRFVTHAGMITWIGKVNDSDLLDGYNSDVNATANTVVVRDGSGQINSTASSAQYADLAEMYSTKEKYTVGTLVQISSSDDYDIEENTNNIFGVISDKPGFILDDTTDGLPVAMVGKTPVRVIGKINKGDRITANGSVARKALENDKAIGISLSNKYTEEEELIKCFVQVQL